MNTEKRIVYYDQELNIEAYHFEGIMQKFPNHFHEHYVLGFVESGCRHLICKNRDYTINSSDLVLINPMENHTCEQIDEAPLDWRCLNVEKAVMIQTVEEITGYRYIPMIHTNVIPGCELVPLLKELHGMILSEKRDLRKEEVFYLFMEQLISDYTETKTASQFQMSNHLTAACEYMEEHYMDPVTLNDLSRVSGLNKYTLLRSFTVQRGITPYQYLSTLRVNQAKKLLEADAGLSEAALETGFSDQSHFTRFFKSFIGVTPKVYQNMYRKERRSQVNGGNDEE